MKRPYLFCLLFALLLAACAERSGAEKSGGAAQAVEAYYQAILQQDADRLSTLTCADFEDDARTELDSFAGVAITLDGFSCAQAEENGAEDNGGAEAQVTCQGKIVASYGNEKMDFPLAERSHRVVNEGGDWHVCGY